MMDVKPVRNEADYHDALAAVEPMFDAPPAPGTAEADEFEVRVALIAAYEDAQWPIDDLDPVELVSSFMAERGYNNSDLAEVVGSASRASEFLSRKRALTLSAINRLVDVWRLPAHALIKPYHLDK